MKFTTFIIIALLAYLAYSRSPRTQSFPTSSSEKTDATDPATPIPAKMQKAPKPAVVKSVAQENGISEEEAEERLTKAMKSTERMRLRGSILQHLNDGHLLMRASVAEPKAIILTTDSYALFGYPSAELMADGTTVDCLVCPVGTYQYTDVRGATRTIYEVIYTNTQAIGKRGDWMRTGRFGAQEESEPAPLAPTPRPLPRIAPPRKQTVQEIEAQYGTKK